MRTLLIVMYLQTQASRVLAWSASPSPNLKRTSLLKAASDGYDEDTSSHLGYNVLGTELACCCSNVGGSGVGTGFYRNGYCCTGEMDYGRHTGNVHVVLSSMNSLYHISLNITSHTVCCRVTSEFLDFSKSVGNDLSTPVPEYNFPGLTDGDIWCLCALRWAQAYNAGKAPRLFLQSTHQKTLDHVPLDVLRIFAIDSGEAEDVLGELKDRRSRLNKILEMDESEDNTSFQ
jgi:uncharacterized protein (DUF2237 family)